MGKVRGKRLGEYIEKVRSELYEEVAEIEYSRLKGKVSIASIKSAWNGKRAIKVRVQFPAYGVLYRRSPYGKFCFNIPAEIKNEEGYYYLYITPIRKNNGVIYCKTIGYEKVKVRGERK